jgi:hypothetical protein
MKPELRPDSRTRKGGSSENDESVSLSTRRSEIGHRHRQHVGGERHRLAVEVAARQHLAAVGEDQRVVGHRVHLDLDFGGDLLEQVAGGAVYLRHAAQAVGVLDPHVVLAV